MFRECPSEAAHRDALLYAWVRYRIIRRRSGLQRAVTAESEADKWTKVYRVIHVQHAGAINLDSMLLIQTLLSLPWIRTISSMYTMNIDIYEVKSSYIR